MSICYGCFSEKNNASICPHCGYEEKSDKGNLILPAGTLLQDRYIVGRVLGPISALIKRCKRKWLLKNIFRVTLLDVVRTD